MKKHLTLATTLTCMCLSSMAQAETSHIQKTISVIQSPDTRTCLFFQLDGVAEADPVVPNVAWFALPQAHVGYDEIFSMILTAYTTGTPINVYTTSTVQCGHAGVNILRFE